MFLSRPTSVDFGEIETSDPFERNTKFQLADFERQNAQTSFGDVVTFGVPAVIAGAFDTFAQTFGFVEEGEVSAALQKYTPQLGTFFDDNEGAVKFVGDVAGSFLPATLGFKAVRAGSKFHKIASGVFGEKRITPFFSTGLSNQKLWERYQEEISVLAKTGSVSLDKFPEFRTIRRKAIGRSVADTAIEAVAADAAVAATMNSSEVLFPDDYRLVDHLIFFGGVNTLISGGAFAIAKHSFNRFVQDTFGPVARTAQNPNNIPAAEAFTRMVGQRGPAISTFNRMRQQADVRAQTAREAGNTAEMTELNNQSITFTEAAAKQFVAAARDNPIDNVTRSYNIEGNSGVVRTLHAVGKVEPDFALGLTSLEEFVEEAADITEKRLMSKTIGLKTELQELARERQALLKKLRESGPDVKKVLRIKDNKLKEKMQKTHLALQDLEKNASVVFELDGTISTALGRQAIFQDGARTVARLPDGIRQTTTGNRKFSANPIGELKIPADLPMETSLIPSLERESLAIADLSLDNLQLAKAVGAQSLTDLKQRLRTTGDFNLTLTDDVKKLRAVFDDTETIIGYSKAIDDSEISLTKTATFNRPRVVNRDDIWGMVTNDRLLVRSSPGKVPSTLVNPLQFASLGLKERTAAMDALQAVAEDVNPTTWGGVVLPDKIHWTQADFLTRLVKQYGDIVSSKIEGFTSLDDLEFRSLASKAEEYQFGRQLGARARELEETHWGQNLESLARGLNLPTGRHPIYKLLETLVLPDKGTLPLTQRVRNMDEVRTALKQEIGAEIDEATSAGFSTSGQMLNLPRNRKPVVGLVRNIAESPLGVSKDELLTQTLAVRAEAFRRLKQFGGPLSLAALDVIENNPAMVASIKNNLPEIISGLQNSGLVMSQVVQQSHRLRGTPGFQALNLVTDLMDKAGKREIEKLFQSSPPALEGRKIKDVFNEILSLTAEGDLLSFSAAANALRAGWNVKEAIPISSRLADGTEAVQWQYVLDSTEQNRAVWSRLHPEKEFPTDDVVLMPTSGNPDIPVAATDLAHKTVEAYSFLDNIYLQEVNGQRLAQGLKLKKGKRYHVPPKNLAGQSIVYLLDNSGTVRTTVPASTPQAARRLAEQEIENSQIPLTMVDDSTMERFHVAREDAFFDMSDFSNPRKQTGPAKGTSAGTIISRGRGEFREMNETVLRHLNDVSRETRLLFFDPELQFLKRQSNTVGVNKKNGASVFDLMVNTMVGTQNLTTASIPGKFLLATESSYDQLMQRIFDKLPNSNGGGFLQEREAKITYNDFVKKTAPEFNPFNDFNDFIEKTAKIKLPRELRKDAGTMNEITTALAIRIFDVGMSAINVLSLASTLFPVVKMLQRLPGESVEKHMQRIAAFGATTPEGLAYFSPTRAAISGVHFFFSEEGRRIAALAKDKGFFDQFAAEQVEIFARTGEGYVGGLLRSATNKASILTDKTERLARAVSWMTFYNVGKKGLGLHDEGAMAFAHAQANNTIADFRPANRPVIFQGAAGMPLGLFTTFMWNYLQRVYSLVETANVGGLINQVGLQTTLFGAESVPGVPEFINMFTSNYDGSENLVDRLHRAFGQDATSAILNGSISTLSGVSIGPRAAIGLPFQSGISAQAVAGFRMAGKAVGVAHQTLQNTVEAGEFDPGMTAEIIARSNINKGVSNAIEYFQGFATDTAGNLIERDTQSGVSLGARIVGMKPLFADELRQENRRNQITDTVRNGLKQRLGERLQSAQRRDNLNVENVEDAVADYMRAGGNPENFKRFFSGQVIKATQSKRDLEIAKALKNSNDSSRLARLMFLGE